jgi:hypothetical protein
MIKTIRLLVLPLAFTTALFFQSCVTGEEKNETETIQEPVDEQDDFKKEQIKKILYTVPSPMSMASLIKKAGATFDKSLMNDVARISNYNTSSQQAMNLGIYGADLSYSSMFDQDHEAILYLSAVQKLCTELGIEGAIDSKIYERLNNHMSNRDSVLNIVSETYFSLDIYLKKADREDLLALIIAGGWFEGLHLATKHLNDETPELRTRIAEQKYAVEDLMKLLDSYEENDLLAAVKSDVAEMKSAFDAVEIKSGKSETSTDDSGKTVIGGSKEVTMSDESLAMISEKVTEIREKYIK